MLVLKLCIGHRGGKHKSTVTVTVTVTVIVTVTVTVGSAKLCMELTRAIGQRSVAHKFEFLAQFTLTDLRPLI